MFSTLVFIKKKHPSGVLGQIWVTVCSKYWVKFFFHILREDSDLITNLQVIANWTYILTCNECVIYLISSPIFLTHVNSHEKKNAITEISKLFQVLNAFFFSWIKHISRFVIHAVSKPSLKNLIFFWSWIVCNSWDYFLKALLFQVVQSFFFFNFK